MCSVQRPLAKRILDRIGMVSTVAGQNWDDTLVRHSYASSPSSIQWLVVGGDGSISPKSSIDRRWRVLGSSDENYGYVHGLLPQLD